MEVINGKEVIHNKRAERVEIDKNAKVEEKFEIEWQDG